MDKKEIDEIAFMEKYFEKLAERDKIYDSQLKRFHEYLKNNSFEEIVNKITTKYESDAYKDRHFNRGYEPPEDLYQFLYDYVMEYGREATSEEYEKYGNMFSVDIYYIDGYYFNMMIGQGSAIDIIKAE